MRPEVESVKTVLRTKDLSVGYDKPLATVCFELLRGQKLGIIGDNGIGKSTLIKTLMGEIRALDGTFDYGIKTHVGYFNQQMAQYSSHKSVFDDFYDEFPHLNETQVRTALGSFLFSGDDVFKCVDDLSGGERVRLALCKIFKKRPNVLILDEPTNHMDIVGKETLENMLSEYEGTVIFVSHDRYFVNKVADKLLVFDERGATFYPVGYAEFEVLEKERAEREVEQTVVEKQQTLSGGKKTFSTPLKEKSKKQKRVAKLEQFLAECEQKLSDLNLQLEDPNVYSDYVKVAQVQNQIDEQNTLHEQYSEEWIVLCEELEQME